MDRALQGHELVVHVLVGQRLAVHGTLDAIHDALVVSKRRRVVVDSPGEELANLLQIVADRDGSFCRVLQILLDDRDATFESNRHHELRSDLWGLHEGS